MKCDTASRHLPCPTVQATAAVSCQLLWIALLICTPTASASNSLGGDLNGSVTELHLDAIQVVGSVQIVPFASVSLENERTGLRVQTKADAGGNYQFQGVPAGLYRVQADGLLYRHVSIGRKPSRTLTLLRVAAPAKAVGHQH